MYVAIKRIFDFLMSLIMLVILSPLLIPITIGLLLTGEGFVFYLQNRVGFKNKHFNIYKFATMLKDSPNMGSGLITTKKDPRITPMGGFLRKSKINELPQLLNILKGDMSFVGPRPVMPKSFAQYPKGVQEVIYDAMPGLTGVGSIIFRDEEELITAVRDNGGDTWKYYTEKIYPFKGQLEKWYQSNRSLLLDFKIIIATAVVIFHPNSKIVQLFFPDLPTRDF